MPREYYLDLLKSLLNLLTQGNPELSDLPKLFVEGSICIAPQLYNIIEELNGIIIDENLCTGSRLFERSIKCDSDPIKGIAESLIKGIHCPCKYNPHVDRGDYLLQRVIDSRADGAIFYLHKFCEPHFFDYPYLKK